MANRTIPQHNFKDMTGQRFGLLRVRELRGKQTYRWRNRTMTRAMWLCDCDCGNPVVVSGGSLRSGNTRSCGCRKPALGGAWKHGRTNDDRYQVWADMKGRCLNPKSKIWKYYGGRGIKVCDRWLESFENFLADVGERLLGMWLDRIDNDGNYEPGNVRWATPKQQSNNRRP